MVKENDCPFCWTYKQTYSEPIRHKMDQHTGGKWLIHGLKHQDNQLQNL